MLKMQINLGKLRKKVIQSAFASVEYITKYTFKKVKDYSPISSGTYVSSHQYFGPRLFGNKIIGIVSNTDEKAIKVEFGWRKTAVNWNLQNIGQIYHSKGASVYKKASIKAREIFHKK